ncbi:hypothetical protein [Shewanella gelidii]|uniref:DUF4178 domain-containing protein n=1 Tax=Shewanella gelidii TaxID=1642821 RepID=A0A917JJ40_9GAMM|nr:hypothetical protein [Shewanella gelidii]MCL1096887.1 hypothetical protein [Shewanella gelidii]GGI70895.1 hypothetical protein GCM10009332_05280 [Shewanella gelidii]
MGLFDGIFGKKEAPARQLDHPNKLVKGDMISIDDSFALPSQLRGKQLQVESVSTYEYQRSQEPEWLLKGHDNETIFMSIDEDDETYLAFSIKLNRGQVEQLFALEQFGEIFEENAQVQLDRLPLSPELDTEFSAWTTDQYHLQTSGQFGYFHRQDYRGQRPPQEEDSQHRGEAFESYQLLDAEEDFAIDIEVYENGETDVMLTIYRPLSDIREYWPVK